jgi:hypothetical protein
VDLDRAGRNNSIIYHVYYALKKSVDVDKEVRSGGEENKQRMNH